MKKPFSIKDLRAAFRKETLARERRELSIASSSTRKSFVVRIGNPREYSLIHDDFFAFLTILVRPANLICPSEPAELDISIRIGFCRQFGFPLVIKEFVQSVPNGFFHHFRVKNS